MIKQIRKIPKSIGAFFRGYSIASDLTEALLERKRTFDEESQMFLQMFGVNAYLDSIREVNRAINRGDGSLPEQYGVKAYSLLNPVKFNKAMGEFGTRKQLVNMIK